MATAEELEKQRRRKALRAALDGVALTPDVTRDEIEISSKDQATSADAELLRNVPPHHG